MLSVTDHTCIMASIWSQCLIETLDGAHALRCSVRGAVVMVVQPDQLRGTNMASIRLLKFTLKQKKKIKWIKLDQTSS